MLWQASGGVIEYENSSTAGNYKHWHHESLVIITFDMQYSSFDFSSLKSKISQKLSHKFSRNQLVVKSAITDRVDRWIAKNRSLVLRQTPIWAQALLATVVGVGSIAVLGSVLFKIDEVITVSGQLQSVQGTTEVKTPAGGKILEVYFEEGQLVKKGDLLVKFDTTQAINDKATLTELIELEQLALARKLNLLNEKQAVLDRKVNTYQKIVDDMQVLVGNGAFRRVEYLKQLDQLFQLRSDLSGVNIEKSVQRLTSEKSISEMKSRLQQAELLLRYQNVVAPTSGVIFRPQAVKLGVLQAGETIVSIVPQSGLKAEILVPNKDIGFVKTGLSAKVRVDAFPFTRYGELNGVVTHIGADALPPDNKANFYRFPVRLSLDKPFLESKQLKIPLRSGMAVTANLRLREKRVISLVSDILVDQTDSVRSIRQQ